MIAFLLAILFTIPGSYELLYFLYYSALLSQLKEMTLCNSSRSRVCRFHRLQMVRRPTSHFLVVLAIVGFEGFFTFLQFLIHPHDPTSVLLLCLLSADFHLGIFQSFYGLLHGHPTWLHCPHDSALEVSCVHSCQFKSTDTRYFLYP